MAPSLRLLIPFVLFPLASAGVLRLSIGHRLRVPLFACVNVLGLFGLCLVTPMSGLAFWQLKSYLLVAVPVFFIYLLTALFHFVLTRAFAPRSGWLPWLAFLFPIAVMLAIKNVPAVSAPFQTQLRFIGKNHIAEFFIGISYMAFRLSHLVLEVRNGVVPPPSLSEYLSFALFVPTLPVGPINPYSVFRESLYKPDRSATPFGRSALRIIVGLTKYLFLASVLEQLTYNGLLLDGHPHPWIDLPIAAIAFYLYLYLNFSGYCDMAIGTAGLIGIRVIENFDRPFQARNIQEFWTRWHISLSLYLRDMVFSPLSKALVRRFGPAATPHAVACAAMAVFLLMGAWHGLSGNFLIYGALHGTGVVACHYYTMFLKKRLLKAGYSRYNKSPQIRWAGITATFLFAAATLFFFANSIGQEHEIFRMLR
jgi:D-alanyl-lipoteichoic acid acyltransferase DltB (MBOAT superfamily)